MSTIQAPDEFTSTGPALLVYVPDVDLSGSVLVVAFVVWAVALLVLGVVARLLSDPRR